MELHFHFDPERLTLDDLCEIESGTSTALFMRRILAKFVQVGGVYIDAAAGWKSVGVLTVPELRSTWAQFWAALRKTKEDAVNPTIEAV